MSAPITADTVGSSERPRSSDVPSFKSVGWPIGVALFAVMLVLRIVYASHFRFDTDEPQHLHVVWGWANGHMQYRDVFDNHGPIFHLLCVPLFRILGERPDILIPMRLAMLPLFAISLWCIFQIGAALFSRQVGFWAALLTGFYPEFFLTSTEFRTDNLWTVLWLLALVVAARGSFNARRAFLVGLFLGAAFGVTVKTGLMVGSLALAAAVMTGWNWMGGRKLDWRSVSANVAAGLCGLAIIPGVLILGFVAEGAGQQFLYCNISHNLVPNAQNWEHLDAHILWFPIFAAFVVGVFWNVKRRELDGLTVRRWCLVLTAGFYFTALKTFFPTLSRQDDLPVIPLAFLVFVAAIFLLSNRLVSRPKLHSILTGWFFPLVVVAEVLLLALTTPFWKNNTLRDNAMVADVLRATGPGDFVMDATGETIFRMRPYYYALEAFTKVRIERGLVKDDIIERLIATRTPVVRPDALTNISHNFVRNNYLTAGNGLWMLGKQLIASGARVQDPVVFEIIIPARYVVLNTRSRKISGSLDGTPVNEVRWLDAGKHTFVRTDDGNARLSLFWAEGFEKGFSPFAQ